MIVLKFGGTSIGSPESINNIPEIISRTGDNKLIVVSAVRGVTDLLLDLLTKIETSINSDIDKELDEFNKIHSDLISDLDLNANLADQVNSYLIDIITSIKELDEITENSKNRILMSGEKASTMILKEYLEKCSINASIIDIDEMLSKDGDQFKILKSRDEIFKSEVTITQGFFAGSNNGLINLGRGGSDLSAAILGSLLLANEIQIWKDVDGILSADPDLVKSTKVIPKISFANMNDMARYGAKVLHPDAIKPAIEKNIPVKILNTFSPDSLGTLISNEQEVEEFRAVVLKEDLLICKLAFSNSDHIYKEIEKLNKLGVKIFEFYGNDNYFEALISDNIDLSMIDLFSEASFEKSSAICLIGNSPAALLKILRTLPGDFNFHYYPNKGSILLMIPPSDHSKLLNLIHEIIISSWS